MSDDDIKVVLTVDLLLFAAMEMGETKPEKSKELRETAAGLLGTLAGELKDSRPDLIQMVLDDLKGTAIARSLAN